MTTGITVKANLGNGKGLEDVPIESLPDAELKAVIARAQRFGQNGWELVFRLATWIRDHPPVIPAPLIPLDLPPHPKKPET